MLTYISISSFGAQSVSYWDMPVVGDRALQKLLNPQDYVLNPFHQPNEIYEEFTCHGGRDGNGDAKIGVLHE